MASKNTRAEALRLAEAKRAIRKMKEKRKQAKHVRPVKETSNATHQHLSFKKEFDGFTEEELQGFHRQVIINESNEDLSHNLSVSPKHAKAEASGSGVGFQKGKPDTHTNDKRFFSNFLSLPIKSEHVPSPDVLVLRSVKKTYSRKKPSVSEEVVHKQVDTTPETTIKIKKLKPLKVLSKRKRPKKVRVPMSVTMPSAKSRGLVFTTLLDNASDENKLMTEGILSAKVSSVISSKKPLKSNFSVTTVSDSLLPESEEITDEDEYREAGSTVESADENDIAHDFVEDFTPERDLARDDCSEELMDDREVVETIKRVKNDGSKAQFHFIDGRIILHLKHPASFVFCGQVQIEVLKGTVEILGYSCTSTAGSLTAFSPRGSCLLSLNTILSEKDLVSSPVDMDSSSLTSLVNEGNPGDAFLVLKKSESILPLFLEQYVSMKLFPQLSAAEVEDQFWKAGKKLNCIFSPPSGCKLFHKGKLWDEVSDHVVSQQHGCTVLCGGKGVGKSTMLRFLVNRLLSNGKGGVVLIDFDPGQAELTLPGCVSISIISKPLLGPNFTHLQNSERCIYIGDINVSNCVSRYVDACVTIVNHWQSQEKFKEMPCLVNTMGFSKGLGVTLMVQILSILQPTSVIQIMSKSASHNYPKLLSVDYVKRNCSNSPFRLKLDMQTLTQGRRLSCASSINYNLHVVDSAAEFKIQQQQHLGLDARSLREIAILSYFSQIVSPPRFSLLEVVPYCCPLDANYLNICHESVPPSITLSVFNASLVALCKASPNEEDVVKTTLPGLPSVITRPLSADCLGFGIVRGICMDSKQLYLLTPISPSELIDVNCLVVGAVTIPPCVLLTPPKEPGPVPYAVVGESKHTTQPSKRSFRFRKITTKP